MAAVASPACALDPAVLGSPREPDTPTKEREDDDLSERSTECSTPSAAEEERVAAADAAPQQAPRVATLFILDWDDTVMPTTWLNSTGSLTNPALARQYFGQLSVAAEFISRTICMLKQLGQLVIVTNAEEGWVQQSIVHFMPGLLPLLFDIQVLSARALFAKRAPDAPCEWKRLTFESIVGSFCRRLRPGQQANVVSIGDLLAERVAVHSATVDAPTCWGKSLKLHERPDLKQLVREHQLLQSSLQWVVAEPRDLDLSIKDGCGDQ